MAIGCTPVGGEVSVGFAKTISYVRMPMRAASVPSENTRCFMCNLMHETFLKGRGSQRRSVKAAVGFMGGE